MTGREHAKPTSVFPVVYGGPVCELQRKFSTIIRSSTEESSRV
jgi:hypothetical protein